MLAQLVYVSSRKDKCTDQEIEKILEACKKNNPKLDITGVLLYSDEKFIQYLEGDSKEILALYDKIKEDDRHERSMVISYAPIQEKSFPSWHMANKKVENDINYRTDISPSDKKVFNALLTGKEQEGPQVLNLLKKFF